MKTTIISGLLCTLATAVCAQLPPALSRVEGSPYPVAAETPDKLYLTSENFTYAQKITLQSLQGMLARTKPEILRDTHGHAAVVESYVAIDRSYYNNFKGLLARYADRFDGYLLCEAKTASVNVALSLCPALNAIAVPVDLEPTAKEAGYALVADVRGKDEAWAIENYGDRLSQTIASYQAVNDDRALCLGDYSVFAGALQFWDSSATGTLARSVYERMNPGAVYFGWGAGEYNTVEQLSQRSAMIHPSDWSPNLSTLSNIPVRLPRQKMQPSRYQVVPDVHTVCFVITDGDNIQWLSGSLNNTNNWANPDKARLKLGWTVSPAFAELAPALYRRYVENALTSDGACNTLIAGPSGVGYYFPSLYPQLAAQNQFLNRMMKKADLRIVNIIDQDGNHKPDEYLKQSNIDALFYYSYGAQYTQLAGEIKWYKNKPSIGGRFTLWGNSDDGSAETRNRVCQNLANRLNTQSTNIHSSAGYSLIPVHIWTMNPSDVLNCINKLNPKVRVVSPDEFVWLIRKNVRKLPLADGNGLSAEYSLSTAPETPLVTTVEPTIDLDDDYLTEGTAALGDKRFTVVWRGRLQPIYSQRYVFHTTAQGGGVVLTIDGQTLCDSIDNASVCSADTLVLEAGRQYAIECRYQKNGGHSQVMLEWESESQVRQRIPHYQLFSRPQPSAGLVTAYEDENYEGYSAALRLGDYPASALEKAGFEATQCIRSIRVTDGLKVVLFSEDECSGDSLVVTADAAQLPIDAWATASLRVTVNGEPLPEGIYQIKQADGNNVASVVNGYTSDENGQKLQLARNTGSINQQFRFAKLPDGNYRIQPLSSHNGKSIEVADFSKENNAAIQQWKTADEENQAFVVVPTGEEGIYRIYSSFSGKIIESATANTSAAIRQAVDVNQSTARWRLEAVAPLPNGNGTGLTANYYNGKDFNTLRATQIDTTINFDWGTARPNRNVNADNISIRWEGSIEPRTSGNYQFFVNSDNGRRLRINGRLIIDKWLDDYDIEYMGTTSNLTAGERYDIKLEYFESTGGAYCRLEWRSPQQPREIVPRSQLYPLDYNALAPPSSGNDFAIYPNPVRGTFITIEPGNCPFSGEIRLNILDMTGRTILSQPLDPSGNRIDISGIPSGIYLVSLTDKQTRAVRKLIIEPSSRA